MIKCRHDRYLQLAKRIAQKSPHPAYRHGCVIVNRNNVISFGYNQDKSHPKSPNKYHKIHAEFHAILGVALSDLLGSTLYSYRESKAGKIGIAKPCSDCQKLIEKCGIKKVIYTTDSTFQEINI